MFPPPGDWKLVVREGARVMGHVSLGSPGCSQGINKTAFEAE